MVVERHFEFMVDNPGAVLGVSQSEFINRLLLFDDTIRKYQKMLDSSGKKKYSEYTFGAPATINDAGCSHIAEKAVKKILGEDGLALYTKTPGGEDFAYSWSAGLEFMPLWAVEMRRRINAIRYTINDLIWMKKEC